MPENNHEYIQQIIQDGEEVISSINDIIDEIDDSIRLLLDCIKKDGKIKIKKNLFKNKGRLYIRNTTVKKSLELILSILK